MRRLLSLVLPLTLILTTAAKPANTASPPPSSPSSSPAPSDPPTARWLPNFKWFQPFADDGSTPNAHFDLTCEATGTFRAAQYRLADLDTPHPRGLAPYKAALQPFLARGYAGSWDGFDPGGAARELLLMRWGEVPPLVRDWVEAQHRIPYNERVWAMGVFGKPRVRRVAAEEGAATGRGMEMGDAEPEMVAEVITADRFGEVPAEEKVLIFAPGAMYEILPLFVAEKTADLGCQSLLRDLSKYDSYMKDDGVVAWPIAHTAPEAGHGQDITFTVRAQHVTDSEHGKTMRKVWEKIHRLAHRQNRKADREEREAKRRRMEAGLDDEEDSYGHDEL